MSAARVPSSEHLTDIPAFKRSCPHRTAFHMRRWFSIFSASRLASAMLALILGLTPASCPSPNQRR